MSDPTSSHHFSDVGLPVSSSVLSQNTESEHLFAISLRNRNLLFDRNEHLRECHLSLASNSVGGNNHGRHLGLFLRDGGIHRRDGSRCSSARSRRLSVSGITS